MKKLLSICLLLLALVGCSTSGHWVRSGAPINDLQFKQDDYVCRHDATWYVAVGTFIRTREFDKDMYRRCMEAHGYEWVK